MHLSTKKNELVSSSRKDSEHKLSCKLENAKVRRALFSEGQTKKSDNRNSPPCEPQHSEAAVQIDATSVSMRSDAVQSLLEPQAEQPIKSPVHAERIKAVAMPDQGKVSPDAAGRCVGTGDDITQAKCQTLQNETATQGQTKPMHAIAMTAMAAGALLAAVMAQQMNFSIGE